MERERGRQTEEGGSGILGNLKYFLLIYLVINGATQYFQGDKPTGAGPSPSTGTQAEGRDFKFQPNLVNCTFETIRQPDIAYRTVELTNKEGEVTSTAQMITFEQAVFENSQNPPRYMTPIAPEGALVSYEFYISEEEQFEREGQVPVVRLDHVDIATQKGHTHSIKFPISENARVNNGSVYLYSYVMYDEVDVVGMKKFQLNTYMKKKKEIKLHKLVGGDADIPEESEEEEQEQPIVAYWHPNVTIAITQSPGLIDTKTMPPQLLDVFPLDPLDRRDNNTGMIVQYFPLLYQNKFWQLKDHMTEINSTVEELELNLSLDFAWFWKIQALVVFSDGIQQQQENPNPLSGGGLSDGSEIDAVKKILLDTNPYLLAITIAVSLLHSLLEFLAFKNDISHWRNKKDNVGVSVRSIIANVVQQIITLLYLLDNSEGTSFMILASQGIGILVEAWKITTILKFEVEWVGIIPSVKVLDKYELTETEEKTKEYDSIAFKYLYWVSIPLLSGYAIYSLLYKEHKSWYSFIVTTLVGFVYTYGFLTLVPSVYINYRLKSVAHIPKKAMAYKFVNTFIDDLFAFVIKMPWLHRLATLRDDVIFLIYIYQTWIYRVDYSRVNEYGQVGEDDVDVKDEKNDETKKEK